MQEMHQNASNEVLKSLNQEKSVEINYENMKVKLIKILLAIDDFLIKFVCKIY